ncbi:hypothetical protein [Celeribacter sp.]|uniref:hypothetical protein n=1 Tax=Celeribacter sp. TaxID=1890673 RepID=UPI003A8E52EC
MAYVGTRSFEKRLTKVEVQRRKLDRGAVYSVNQDGLILARPRRHASRSPLRLVFFTLLGVLLFKALVLASLGTVSYNARVATLQDGTVVERIGAWIMTADPSTVWVAKQGKLLFSGL